MALKWDITEKFCEYLIYSKFVVFTDHNPLKYLDNLNTGQRWAAQLEEFDFEINYKPGAVDAVGALSRLPNPVEPEAGDTREDFFVIQHTSGEGVLMALRWHW